MSAPIRLQRPVRSRIGTFCKQVALGSKTRQTSELRFPSFTACAPCWKPAIASSASKPYSVARSITSSVPWMEGMKLQQCRSVCRTKGYTEPDARIDLSGTDVARKMLILARMCGAEVTMEDVQVNGFLPEAAFAGDLNGFHGAARFARHSNDARAAEATAAGKRLAFCRFVPARKPAAHAS